MARAEYGDGDQSAAAEKDPLSIGSAKQRTRSVTYTIVEMTATTKRGSLANARWTVMKLVQTVYIVGAQALGAVKLNSTSKNFPNLPVGARTAATSPPTSPPSPRPARHEGTETEAAANAAPSMCAGTCNAMRVNSFLGSSVTVLGKNIR